MFGKRSDGRLIKTLPYFFKIIPHIMVKRYDASNLAKTDIDYDLMMRYVRSLREAGHSASIMTVILSAYLRTLALYPYLNRFVVNKKIYARKYISVCFAMLKQSADGSVAETVVKIILDLNDTVFDVIEKADKAIKENRKAETANATDKLANLLMSLPIIPRLAINALKFLDHVGILPRSVIEASPFHTSMFITNMASIKMSAIYHHLYDFGTTSVFLSMGEPIYKPMYDDNGQVILKKILPMGTTTDERICSGSEFATAWHAFKRFLRHPELLEIPLSEIKKEIR